MKQMSNKFFIVREYKPEDKNFVMASFLRGVYYGNPFYNMTPKDDFMNNYKHVGEALIANASIKVACLPDDIDIILGYCITSKDAHTLHWCFVKSAWRKSGIAKALLSTDIHTFTHFSELGLSLKHKLNKAIFNPFK